MKIRTSLFGHLVLIVGLLCMLIPSSAIAQRLKQPSPQRFKQLPVQRLKQPSPQRFKQLPVQRLKQPSPQRFKQPQCCPVPMHPPCFVPMQPFMTCSIFHVTVGAKWRRVSARFETNCQSPRFGETAITVPFGPTTDGNVNYPAVPSGNAFDPPDLNGMWVYSDGLILPYSPGLTPQDLHWTSAIGGLGHDTVVAAPRNTGLFVLADPTTQTSNGGSFYSETTSVTFSLRGVGGALFTTNIGPRYHSSKDSDLWAPYLELGIQWSCSVDVFVAFSGFSFGKSYGATVPFDVSWSTLNAVDTYPFQSSNSSEAWVTNWAILSTSIGGAGEPAEGSYLVFPSNGTRQFTTAAEYPLPLGTLQDTLTSRIDLTMFETKVGGRWWSSLNELAKLNTGFGMLFAWIPYQISNTSRLANPAEIIPPTGAPIPANTEFRRTENRQQDTWFDVGMFGSLGLELGTGGWFVAGDFEYDWYWLIPEYESVVRTSFNPSGFSANAGAGLRF